MLQADTVDGQLLGDYLRATTRATKRVALVVTGERGSGKSTALRRFLSGCQGHSLVVAKMSKEQEGADVLYGDYFSLTEERLGQREISLPCKACLVVDDLHVWVQLRRLNGKEIDFLSGWHGHLVLSCLSMDCVPPSVSSTFIVVEYPLAINPQFVTRQLLLSHPRVSLEACARLALLTPKQLSASDVLKCISSAKVVSQSCQEAERAAQFENAYVASVSHASSAIVSSSSSLPILPPSLEAHLDKLKILIGQYLTRFGFAEVAGPVARVTSSTTGILLSGVSGCGKTLLTHSLESAFPSIPFLRVGCHEFFGKYLGESEERLRTFFKKARKMAPCVVVMEDIDVIAQARQGGGSEGSSVAKRMLTAFLCELDGVEDTSGVLSIGTTSAVTTLDGALLRQGRLETVIEIGCLSPTDISALIATKTDLLCSTRADESSIKNGLVGKPFSSFALVVRQLVEQSIVS